MQRKEETLFIRDMAQSKVWSSLGLTWASRPRWGFERGTLPGGQKHPSMQCSPHTSPLSEFEQVSTHGLPHSVYFMVFGHDLAVGVGKIILAKRFQTRNLKLNPRGTAEPRLMTWVLTAEAVSPPVLWSPSRMHALMRILCYSFTQAGRVRSCVTLAEILHTRFHKHIDRHQRAAAAELLTEQQLTAEGLLMKRT